MKFKVTIKEISKAEVEVETEYWKNPLDYTLEPEDTFFE